MARALIHVPSTAKHGEVIEIKTMIAHVMETGYRIGVTGKPIPRDIIDQFACTYNGEVVFSARAVPRHRRQSIHLVLHRRHRQRHVRVFLDRSARQDEGADGRDHGGIKGCGRRLLMRLGRIVCHARSPEYGAIAARNSARSAASGQRIHQRRYAGDAERRHRQSRHAGGARRRGTVDSKRPAPQASHAPTATAMPRPA